MAGSNEEIVRRITEVTNSSESVDQAMDGLDGLIDPEIEYVNPDDAIERGTRKGVDGLRTVIENLITGVGPGATFKLEYLEERGEHVLVRGRWHARGAASGAEALGPLVAGIYTFRDGRVLRIEWHYDVDKATARFEQGDQ